jgi:DNA ligase 1
MVKWYKELFETKGTNDKVAILVRYGSDPSVKEAIRLCYEPFIHTYLQKVPKPKVAGTRDFHAAFSDFRTLFLSLDKREITGNAAKAAVLEFLESVDTDAQEVFTKIIQKDLKVGIAEKLCNKAYGDDFVNIFEVQLGYPYDPDRKYKVDKYTPVKEWFASRKLDGIRGFQEGSDPLRTRNGNKIHGFDHILAEIDELKRQTGLNFVDGELYQRGLPFQTITGYVNADVNINPEHKDQIRFHVFGVGFDTDWHNTYEMVDFIRNEIDWNQFKYLIPVEYEIVPNDPEAIFVLMNRYFEEGFEGAMLRHPYNTYSKGRSHDIVKAKPFYEGDFKVVDYEMGKEGTQFENTLGALIVTGEFKIKDKVYPIRSDVGGGYKIKPELGVTRDQILANIDDWIDTIIEVKFQGVTDKPRADGTYGLRFSTFIRQRVDKRL